MLDVHVETALVVFGLPTKREWGAAQYAQEAGEGGGPRRSGVHGRVLACASAVFLAGLLFSGFVSAALSGGWEATWDAGMRDSVLGLSLEAKIAWMFVGGLFIGFGTRLAGGCTSGHGIFGVSLLEKSSLLATAAFMAAGMARTHLVYRVLGGWTP